MSNKAVIITCASVDNVKPTITVTEGDTATVGENEIAILVGIPTTGRFHSSGRLAVAARDLMAHFVGENRLDVDPSVDIPPAITLNPSDASVQDGSDAVFLSDATDFDSVQWFENYVVLMVGETGKQLVVSAVLADDGNTYRAEYTNTNGTVSTTNATLTVAAAE